MSRLSTYYALNNDISNLSNKQIKDIITSVASKGKQWGLTQVHTISSHKVFIKSIPLADLFAKNVFDSSNLYNLPAYCNYGIGSAGVNPWRELLLHIKTTNYVLQGVNPSFPLLYSYRIIEDNHNDNILDGLDNLDKWNNNKQIKKFLKDRKEGKQKIVMFLEYIPNVAWKYLLHNPNQVEDFYHQVTKIIKFINKNNILHLDAHLGNFLIDNKGKVYLTDFGIALSSEFQLDKNEMIFMKKNMKMDQYYIMNGLLDMYVWNMCMSDEKIKKKYGLDKVKIYPYMIENIDVIKKDINISDYHVKFIKKHSKFLLEFVDWFNKLFVSKNKDKIFLNI